MVNLSVRIGSLTLKNPVMPGSGTFAEGMARVIDINRLGAIVTKTFTDDIREGNPTPRIAELNQATLFSIGIPSKGTDYYLAHILPFYRDYTPPVVASISANTAEEFGQLAAKLKGSGIAALEANISCPNLKKNGKAFGMDAEGTFSVIQAMKAGIDVPVWAKMTPNAGNLAEIAQAAEAAGADALIASNAILGIAIDIETRLPKVANVTGGITGAATKPILLRMAYQCAQAVKIPIIGCGGISNGADIIEYMLAGVTAAQIGTANFISPHAMIDAIDYIEAYCERHGVKDVNALVGAMSAHEIKGMTGVNVF
jgi:dihydroorotate dehydrogenase (NAD+) catalytic subunit